MDLDYLPKLLVNTIANPPVRDTHAMFGFHPSSASVEWEDDNGDVMVVGGCLRLQYYNAADVPDSDPAKPEYHVTGYFGGALHDAVVELTKRAGVWRGNEGRFFIPADPGRKRPPVSGRWDLFINDPRSGRPVGTEIKTIYGYYPEKLYLSANGKPREEDLLQCMIYLDYYGRFGVEKWALLYISRGSGEMRQYNVRIGEEGEAVVDGFGYQEHLAHITVPNIYARWWKLQEAIDAGELPPRDYVRQWSNARIVKEYTAGTLNKKDTQTVKKALSEGETERPLLVKGDWRCGICHKRSLCYGTEWDDTCEKPNVVRPFKDPVLNDPNNAPDGVEPEEANVI